MSEIEVPVQLYVYDLSHGMAAQLSQQLLGVPIEGIWHTSVVVHDTEIYYGKLGIQRSIPGMTFHGDPLKKIDMGKTSTPMEIIEEYLGELGSIFGGEHYNLFDHNCNHMSDELSQFLLGKSIPDWITSLPSTILATPFGQMLRPLIEQAMVPAVV